VSEETLEHWYTSRIFEDGRINNLDEERSGRPAICTDDLFQSADQETIKYKNSKSQNFRVNAHKFHELLFMKLCQAIS
jgi:hypothetical protein